MEKTFRKTFSRFVVETEWAHRARKTALNRSDLDSIKQAAFNPFVIETMGCRFPVADNITGILPDKVAHQQASRSPNRER